MGWDIHPPVADDIADVNFTILPVYFRVLPWQMRFFGSWVVLRRLRDCAYSDPFANNVFAPFAAKQ